MDKEPAPRPDHCGDVIRLIDRVLSEESIVLDGLKKAVEENGITEQEAIARFSAYRRGLRGEPINPPDGAA